MPERITNRRSPRHGLMFNQLPAGSFFNHYHKGEYERTIMGYAAILDCTYEMADQVMTSNGVPAATAVNSVLVAEGWKLLPSHKKMIIAKLEAE